jgi:hypothetical protein
MGIFEPRGTKRTVAYHLTTENVKAVERIAKTLGQSKSAVVDQLIAWDRTTTGNPRNAASSPRSDHP